MPTYYLSFAKEEEGWIGACFVRATSTKGALTITHLEGCNPGGEVMIWEVDEDVWIPDPWYKRLLDKDDLVNLDKELGGKGDLKRLAR